MGSLAALVFTLVAISLFRHSISNEDDNDSKRCALGDCHDVARRTGVNYSTYDSGQEYRAAGNGVF